MGSEFELKYRADEEQIAALQKAYGGFAAVHMETTYYDTQDRKLGQLLWTLRRRYENGVSVCTVKTPAQGCTRGEWETECEDIRLAIPVLCKLGGPAELEELTKSGIIQVCGARFTRLARLVEGTACTVELALDRGVLLGGGTELPFAEIEVELKSGSPEAAVAFAQQLALEYGLIPEPASKYKRALALAQSL